jgi:two-component system, sensor histidine kinase
MLSSDLVRSAFHSAPDAMVVIDASGAIVFANHQVFSLFGYSASDIEGQPVEALLPQRFRERHIAYRRCHAGSSRTESLGVCADLFALRRDGTEFPAEISLRPMEGNPGMLTAAIRDISDRHAIHIQLQDARETADRANQAKSRFLATASHDLRQPLQTLALLNGALRRMVRDPEPAEALAHEEQAISAMSRLLNALLDISKLESGAIKPEVTDFTVAAIFAELRNEFASLAAHKGLQLRIEVCEDCVHSDPSLIEQVLRNLISNAIKYTQRGFVQLRCLQDQAFVRLEVLDTGIGMPPSALSHIYDDFYQVGVSSNTTRDGYGLGLSIVNRIMTLLGHRIEVRSELGKGSTFSLELPRGRKSELHARTPDDLRTTSAAPATRSPHILLVEDDAGVRNATRLLLRLEGFRISTASSLPEALRQATEHSDIELLVTDYHLGEAETGVAVIGAIRRHLGTDFKAILVTGDTSSAVREMPLDRTLRTTSKPINADEPLSVIRELLTA